MSSSSLFYVSSESVSLNNHGNFVESSLNITDSSGHPIHTVNSHDGLLPRLRELFKDSHCKVNSPHMSKTLSCGLPEDPTL